MPIDLTIADEAVARVGRKPEALIPILQALQERYGYLPEEALRRVCETSDITPAAIAGVASFYNMFRMQPTGKHVVRVCRGTACHVAGAERVEDALRRHLNIPAGADTDAERQFTIEQVACLGTCTLAPVMRIGESTMGYTTSEKVPELMRDFLENQATATAVKSTEGKCGNGHGGAPEIHVGLGSCCMAKGSDRLFHALRESAEASGANVVVKRVGCVGMCHRTPMVEVATAAGKGEFYAGLSPEQARALLQRHFKPRGFAQRASRLWTRVLDGLLLDDSSGQRGVERFSMSKRDPGVRAFLDKQVHIATEHFGQLDPLDLDEYLAHGGFATLAKCLGCELHDRPHPGPLPQERENRSPSQSNSSRGGYSEDAKEKEHVRPLSPLPGGEGQGEGEREHKSEIRNPKSEIDQSLLTSAATNEEIISTIERSGLRGRGGAGFPSGQKWRVVSQQASDTKYVICNGDEGDPGAFMDRMILESFPFRVIEGLAIAAVAVGAREGIFYIRHEYPLAVKRVRAAIAELETRGWLGEKLLGIGRPFKISVFEGAGAFVCGEETALIASIEGQRGMPKLRPPFPAQEGLWGKPTLINNVETLALVPWIIRNGAEKFAAIGTAKSKGTKVFALAGKIRRGGLIEVPMGTTIREIVEEIGGGAAEGRRFKAVQIGGPSGGCVPARLADTPVDFESLREVGAIMGSGGLVVLDDSSCMVDIARYFLQFTQDQSCGKCTFCRIGTKRMLDILDRLCTGKATRPHLDELERLAHQVGAGSLCGLGKTAPNPVLTTLRYFREEYEAHLQGRCPAKKCTALVKYTINTDCTGCTICAQHCPVDAIPMAPYAQHVIDDTKCTRCDTCRLVCPHNAVEVR
jgi:NADH:ubiquinone oxidoreductase subunit F (NADH-binding)/NADH:ubiquinone oxidoreductase subunit E/Pyruvate/2-oxoacid:ferredoxin oxidoreductase delta subunit